MPTRLGRVHAVIFGTFHEALGFHFKHFRVFGSAADRHDHTAQRRPHRTYPFAACCIRTARHFIKFQNVSAASKDFQPLERHSCGAAIGRFDFVRGSQMKTLRAITLVASLFIAAAQTASASDSQNDANLVFNCDALVMPSQRDVGDLLDMQNFGKTYAERARLMQRVRSGCLRGVRQVRVTAHDPLKSTAEVADTH
jgi:hypothetical protein